jgi:hypothetical protein
MLGGILLRELELNDIPVLNKWRNDNNLIDSLGTNFRYIAESIDSDWYQHYKKNRHQ